MPHILSAFDVYWCVTSLTGPPIRFHEVKQGHAQSRLKLNREQWSSTKCWIFIWSRNVFMFDEGDDELATFWCVSSHSSGWEFKSYLWMDCRQRSVTHPWRTQWYCLYINAVPSRGCSLTVSSSSKHPGSGWTQTSPSTSWRDVRSIREDRSSEGGTRKLKLSS